MPALGAVEPPRRHPATPPPGTVMGPHYTHCFGCGPEQPHGLHLAVIVGDGVSVTASLTITDDHQGAPGLAHGGVIAAAFDEALGSVLWVLRQPAVTGRLETSYVRPVPVGARLHIAAECTGVQRRKILTRAEARLDAPDGPVAARAAATYITVGLEHFLRYGRPEPQAGVDRFRESSYNP